MGSACCTANQINSDGNAYTEPAAPSPPLPSDCANPAPSEDQPKHQTELSQETKDNQQQPELSKETSDEQQQPELSQEAEPELLRLDSWPEFEPALIEMPSPDERPYPDGYVQEAAIETALLGTFSTHGLMPQPVGVLPIKVNQDYGITVYPFHGRYDQVLLVVCDGHGKLGDQVSRVAATELVEALEATPCMADVAALCAEDEVEQAFSKAFSTAQEKVCSLVNATMSGTTAVVAIITPDQVWTAHSGDSRAVISSEEGTVNNLTLDHKPNANDEYDRLIAAGAKVECDLDGGRIVVIKQQGLGVRKMFSLGVSRGLGDLMFAENGLIHEPAVKCHCVQKDDEWLVLASDGIWEVLSLEQVGEIIAGGCDATAVCRELISKAKQIWRDEEGDYRDDITVTVLRLPAFIEQMRIQHDENKSSAELPLASPPSLALPLFRNSATPVESPLPAATATTTTAAREKLRPAEHDKAADFMRRKCSVTCSGMDEDNDFYMPQASQELEPAEPPKLRKRRSIVSPELDMNLWPPENSIT